MWLARARRAKVSWSVKAPPPGCGRGQPAHVPAGQGHVHLQAVVDVVVQIDLPVAGGVKPAVPGEELAVPGHHRLWGIAEPQAVPPVDGLEPPLLRLDKGGGDSSRGSPWVTSWVFGSVWMGMKLP